jgi:hypothetical protein
VEAVSGSGARVSAAHANVAGTKKKAAEKGVSTKKAEKVKGGSGPKAGSALKRSNYYKYLFPGFEQGGSGPKAEVGADGPDEAAKAAKSAAALKEAAGRIEAAEAKWEATLKEAASRIEAAEAKSAAALKEAASRIEAAEAKLAAALKEAASRIEFAEAATAKAAAALKEAAGRIEAAVTNAAKSKATGGAEAAAQADNIVEAHEVLGGKRPQVEGGEGVDAKRLKIDV